MYFLRSSPLDAMLFIALSCLWCLGGWFLARSIFVLKARERLMVGLGLGFLLHLTLANLFAHVLPFHWAYLLSCTVILVSGVLVWRKKTLRLEVLSDIRAALPIGASFLFLLAIFFLINRGLAIFDEGYNLPLVSRMAAGDVPPHFFLYPSFPMPYHYGLHLFAAALTRLGGFYPWSAFDLARAFTHALMLCLAVLWFWRVTQRWVGGLIGASITYFAGGTQWLLLFAPPTWLNKASTQIPLINSAAVSGKDFYDVLTRPWAIEAGGAAPFPFAFISGIFLPQNLALTSYGACLALTIFLLLLLEPRTWNLKTALVISMVLASLALTGEHLFALLLAALGIIWVASLRGKRRQVGFKEAALLFGLAALSAAFAGGVITVWVERLWAGWFGGSPTYGYGLTGFQLRFPPAVMSVHFGRLELFNFTHLIVAGVQIGPALAWMVLSAVWLYRRWHHLGWLTAALLLCPWLGFLASLVIDYQDRAREITRFLDISLLLGVILAFPLIYRAYPRWRVGWQMTLLVTTLVMIYSGLVTFGVQLLSIPKPQFTYFITPLDAHLTQRYWDALPANAQVFDPNPSRSIVIFGRSAGEVAMDYRKPLPEWEELVKNFNLNRLIEAGYTHLYLDERYWNQMKSQQKSSLERPCVRQISAQEGTGDTFRHLYSLSDCR